jgi:hypothetical protein
LLFGTLGQRCLSLSFDLGALSIAEHTNGPSRSRAPTDHVHPPITRTPTDHVHPHTSRFTRRMFWKSSLKIRLVKKVWGEGGNLTSKVRFFSQA